MLTCRYKQCKKKNKNNIFANTSKLSNSLFLYRMFKSWYLLFYFLYIAPENNKIRFVITFKWFKNNYWTNNRFIIFSLCLLMKTTKTQPKAPYKHSTLNSYFIHAIISHIQYKKIYSVGCIIFLFTGKRSNLNNI